MTLDQARKIMDQRFSENPPAYGDWVVAGQVIAEHYAKHPEKLRPVYTTDARTGPMLDLPGRTLDQPRYQPFEKSREQSRGVKLDESWGNVQGPEAPNPGLTAGADLVQALPGEVSSYFIARDPRTGKAALYRYKQPQTDPGMVGRSSGRTAQTTDRSYYRSIARQASVQRELTGAVLKDINRQNREAWSKRDG